MSSRGHVSSDGNNAVMHGEFMAFASDEESVAVIRAWATRQGYPAAVVQSGGPDMFSQMLEASAPPKMAVVDIDGQQEPVSVATRLISLCGPDTKMIVIGSANDVSLYRNMLTAGVVDYLVKPLSGETLNQALAAALRGSIGGKNEAKEAKIIIMTGVRGGAGATTIAVNTAWLLAHELNFNCALLDLDLQFGTSSLTLDLEPGRGLRDIISSPHRVDGLMIASSMVAESDQFSVLGGEEAVDEAVLMDGAAITALLKEMKGNFDYIVVDLPRHLLASQKRLLAAAHEIVLITDLSLAGIRDTLRIKTALQNLGVSSRLSIIAARTSGARAGQVDVATFERGAQIKIDLTVPEDPKSVGEAANSGKAIGAIAKQSPVVKALLSFSFKLSNTDASAIKKKPSGLFKMLNSIGAKKPAAKPTGKS